VKIKKKIKILSIIDSLNLKDGGPSHSLIDMALANNADGLIHDIMYLGSKQKIKSQDKIFIKTLDDSKLKYGFSLRLIFWLLKNKKNYDLFIIHGIWQFITLISRIIIPNKYLVFTHGMLDPYFGNEKVKTIKKKIYWNLIEKKNLEKAKFVLSNSNKEFHQLKNTFVNTNKIKFKKVNYGLYPKKINFKICEKKFDKKFKFIKNKKFILYIGRIHPKKGCLMMVKAFSKIKDSNFLLLLAGDMNNHYAKNIFEFVKREKLQNKIYFINFIKDQIKWGAIRKAMFTILPSHGENFGVSVVESLYAGTPVICSNKVGIAKIVKKDQAGIIVSDNINSIKSGLIKISNLHKKKIKNFSENSLNSFNKNFNLKINNSFSNWLKTIT